MSARGTRVRGGGPRGAASAEEVTLPLERACHEGLGFHASGFGFRFGARGCGHNTPSEKGR